jgi:pimeloyl-ACP methyl ester carboxylesterase
VIGIPSCAPVSCDPPEIDDAIQAKMGLMERPQVKYAKSGDLNIAYQVVGDGPFDLVIVFGFISHLDLFWDGPPFVNFIERLASFSRVILFDKRGMGLSDPVEDVPTLEERMDDVRAVMDAAGSEKAALFGVSEGGMMSLLFASTYPERVRALVLYGSMARSTQSDDYPYGSPIDALHESAEHLVQPSWGQGFLIEVFAPSLVDIPEAQMFYARLERQAASPQMFTKIYQMFLDLDVRHVLPMIQAPTLVVHRKGDRVVNYRAARYLAERIKGSKYVELPGIDHSMLAGDVEPLLDETQEFLTGVRPVPVADRVLATDIVDSTKKAAELGDSKWRNVLDAHEKVVRKELERHRGREVKTTGDGFLATFDGPARAIRCGVAITEEVRPIGVQVRVGLHTGECEVRGDDVGGIAVHTAARISALAGASEVLVSRTVKDLVAGSGITFEDRGTHTLKGIPDEWALLAVQKTG